MRFLKFFAAAALLVSPTLVSAQDKVVDLGDVKTVAGLLLQAGYKSDLKKNDDGTGYILSATNGSDFTVRFYSCKKDDTGCESFEFFSYYKKKPYFSPAMANEWNARKRFMKVAIDDDGDLVEYVYVSAVGKSTYKNFVDYVEWFTQMDGELSIFLKEKAAAATATAEPAAKAAAKTEAK